jgi:hypothetical protein
MHTMRMTRCVYIWPPLVYSAVNGKGRRIDRLISLHHLSLLIHQYKIRHAYEGEMRRQRIEPEMIGEYGVAHTDVAGDAFVKAT